MERRLKLHEMLTDVLGSENVYFQPPESLKMQYPCIRYERSGDATDHADDILYRDRTRYELILIDPNPDSIFCKRIKNLPLTSYNRHYTADNLNHDVYTIYY